MQRGWGKRHEDDDDALCCCEYLSESQNVRRHLLQFCCDCSVLDEICDQCLRCESVTSRRYMKLMAEMLDRLRIPSPGGAVKLSWKHVLPFIIYPFMVYYGSSGTLMCGSCFIVLMYGTTIYSQIMFTKKQTNTVVGGFIWAYMFYTYALYLLYFFPYHYVDQVLLAVQHALICFFVLFYALTMTGPGFVPIREGIGEEEITYVKETEVEIRGDSVETSSDTFIKYDRDTGQAREYDPQQEFRKLNPHLVAQAEERLSQYLPSGSKHVDASVMGERPRMEAEDMESGCKAYWPVLNCDWFYCTVCKMLVPPLSSHCRTCNRCVYELDHHCFWLDCCVGLQNKRWFLMFMLTLVGANMCNAYVVFKQVCPVSSWYCQDIFSQSQQVRYLFVSTLFGLLVAIYQLYPLLRLIFSLSFNVPFVRLNRFIKSKLIPTNLTGRPPVSFAWLTKYNRGFLRNWARCLCPPAVWEMPSKPDPPSTHIV